jgi:hypothetical protein
MAYSDIYSDTYDFDIASCDLADSGKGTVWFSRLAGGGPYPVWNVAVDFDDDGDFSGTDIISDYVLTKRSAVSIQYGRDQARALNPAQPGQASFTLNNISGNFSPENVGSPYANLAPGRPAIIQATWGGTTYTMYRGSIDDYEVHPDITERSVSYTCLDAQSNFAAVTLSTELYNGISSGDAVNIILDAIGWPSGARDIDLGASQFRWWWEEGTDAWTALQKVIASEGPPAIALIDEGTGNFIFRDRLHRATRPVSTSPQAYFSSDSEIEFSIPFVYDNYWKNIINQVVFNVEERNPPDLASPLIGGTAIDWPSSGPGEITPIPPVIWRNSSIIVVPAGGSIEISAQASDPFFGAQAWWSCIAGSVTASLSRTSGQSTIITLTSTGGDAIVSEIFLYANPVQSSGTVQVVIENSASIAKYGLRTMPASESPVWANQNDAEAIGSLIIAHRSGLLPNIQMRVLNANSNRLEQQLSRNISDRVTVQDDATGLNADFFIEQVKHSISAGGMLLDTTFGCEKAVNIQPSGLFKFDDAAYGRFDTGGVLAI